MPTNFELKRLKPKLDIAKKPENRVHELTDSNVSLYYARARAFTQFCVTVSVLNLTIYIYIYVRAAPLGPSASVHQFFALAPVYRACNCIDCMDKC